tara:strand:+ start:3021 stop:3344 length:324 start_codon:yes stop_codon:yes gene_type:complete
LNERSPPKLVILSQIKHIKGGRYAYSSCKHKASLSILSNLSAISICKSILFILSLLIQNFYFFVISLVKKILKITNLKKMLQMSCGKDGTENRVSGKSSNLKNKPGQ